MGDARVSDRHANFFVNAGKASAKDMLALDRRCARARAQGLWRDLENEVVVWNA